MDWIIPFQVLEVINRFSFREKALFVVSQVPGVCGFKRANYNLSFFGYFLSDQLRNKYQLIEFKNPVMREFNRVFTFETTHPLVQF
jgi:hypothetical protein